VHEPATTFVELTRQVAIGEVDLAWDAWGDRNGRPPLLLCHGFSGSAHDFALHVPALAAQRHVVALDHRGHGRSTKTGDVASYTFDRLTGDLVAFVEQVVGEPVDLLGHSMGGQLALRTTLARPDLVRSLILMDTSGWSFLPDDPAVADALVSFLAAFDPARGLPGTTGLRPDEEALIAARTPEDWQLRKEELSAGFDPSAMKGLGVELFDDRIVDLRHRLGELTCPVTVIAGTLDDALAEQAPQLAAAIAGAELAMLDGAYHSPQLTHPAEWLAAVEGHVAWAEGRG